MKLDWLKQLFGTTISPVSENPVGPQQQDYYPQAIQEGFNYYGSNLGQYADVFSRAPKYDIFQKYPFLLPAIAIAETSGGKNVTYPNNILNWGIRPQASGDYTPESPQRVIMDAMSGIGGRTAEEGFTPEQIRTSNYYEPFRKDQDLRTFAYIHTPPGENDTEKYINDLIAIMSIFQGKYNKGMGR